MRFKKLIDPIMIRGEGRIIDVFYELFTIISSFESEIQSIAFQYVCENAKKVKFEEDNRIVVKEHFTEKQLLKYLPRIKEQFTSEMKFLLYEASSNNLQAEEFYKKLWTLINCGKICRNKHEKALATFLSVDNDLIPYRAVGKGISMEDDEYSSIIDSLDDDLIRDMQMIMEMKYEQKTHKSSLLIEKIDALNTLEEKAVFMSMILETAENHIKNEIKASIDNI